MQRGRMRGTDAVDQAIDLRDALPCLTQKQARALGLWYEGYTQRKIGEALGISQQAVSDCIGRGLVNIRQTTTL